MLLASFLIVIVSADHLKERNIVRRFCFVYIHSDGVKLSIAFPVQASSESEYGTIVIVL